MSGGGQYRRTMWGRRPRVIPSEEETGDYEITLHRAEPLETIQSGRRQIGRRA